MSDTTVAAMAAAVALAVFGALAIAGFQMHGRSADPQRAEAFKAAHTACIQAVPEQKRDAAAVAECRLTALRYVRVKFGGV